MSRFQYGVVLSPELSSISQCRRPLYYSRQCLGSAFGSGFDADSIGPMNPDSESGSSFMKTKLTTEKKKS